MSAPKTQVPEKKSGKAQKQRPRKMRKPVKKNKNASIPYVLNTPAAPAPDNTYSVAVIATLEPGSLRTMLFGIASYILQLGLGGPSERSPSISYTTLWSGLDYMLKGIWEEARSGTIVLAKRPRIIHDIILALSNKVVNVRGGKFAYAWNEQSNILPIENTQYGPLTYWAVTEVGNTTVYNSTNDAAFAGPGTLQDYNKLTEYLDGKQNPVLSLVSSEAKSPLYRDVCTRARVYTYNGLKPVASAGWACSVENELPLIRPSLSKFVAYRADVEDRRIPTQLSIESGDPCTMIGINILGLGGPLRDSYLNRCSPRFIPVDFESVYDVLCLWMVMAKTAAQTGPSNDQSLALSPLPFTQQDFRIALMQALKGLFDTSWVTQFVGPLEYNSGGNAFIPSTCAGNNYGNPMFAKMMLIPELIGENLNALKARAVMAKRADGSHGHSAIYMPIIGRWYQDVPSTYVLGGEAQLNLFAQTSQNSINILDGTYNTVPIDCNNGYYAQVIADWNAHVDAVKPFTSTVGPMFRDRGPIGLPLILTATSERPSNVVNKSQGPHQYRKVIADKYIGNLQPIKNVDPASKRVEYVPAATTPELDLLETYTMLPQTDAELTTLISNLITPSIRFNDTDGDVLNSQMFSVHTRFLNSFPCGNFGDVDTQGKYLKLTRLAQMCITGVGRDTTDVYAALMRTLTDKGKASGLLSILSGIVGTIIPPLAPIASMISGALEK